MKDKIIKLYIGKYLIANIQVIIATGLNYQLNFIYV